MEKMCKNCKYCQLNVKFGVHMGYTCLRDNVFVDLNDTCSDFEWTDFLKEYMLDRGMILL